MLEGPLRQALGRLNPDLPPEALEDAFRRLTRPKAPTLDRATARSTASRGRRDGRVPAAGRLDRRARRRVSSTSTTRRTMTGSRSTSSPSSRKHNRRPDIVLFVNGLPLAIIELKNAADENATVWTAFQPARDLQAEIRRSSPTTRRSSSPTAPRRASARSRRPEWFKPWRTIGGETLATNRSLNWRCSSRASSRSAASSTSSATSSSSRTRRRRARQEDRRLPPVPRGQPRARGDAARGPLSTRIGVAAEQRERYEAGTPGRRARRPARRRRLAHAGLRQEPDDGVLRRARHPASRRWRTRPSSSSPTATTSTTSSSARSRAARSCSASRPCRRRAGRTCARSSASTRAASSSRPSRSSSGREGRHATRCSRTGATSSSSPTRPTAASTTSSTASPATCATPCPTPPTSASPARPSNGRRQHPGRLRRLHQHLRHPAGGQDGATVPIYYESRLAKLELNEAERPKIDPDFEEATEGEEIERKEKLKTKWAQLEAVVGAEKRLEAGRAGHRGALREAARGDGRQGDGRLHEPPHLRGPLRRDRRSCARVARTRTTTRASSRS